LEKIRIDTKKATQAKNKARKETKKAAKVLQAAVKEENIDKVRVKEKAEK
jgi:hypothetical protein